MNETDIWGRRERIRQLNKREQTECMNETIYIYMRYTHAHTSTRTHTCTTNATQEDENYCDEDTTILIAASIEYVAF